MTPPRIETGVEKTLNEALASNTADTLSKLKATVETLDRPQILLLKMKVEGERLQAQEMTETKRTRIDSILKMLSEQAEAKLKTKDDLFSLQKTIDAIPQPVKYAGIGLLGAGITYGLYKLWRGTKNTAKKAAEKTKAGVGWVMKGIAIAAAGVLTVLGFKYASDQMKKLGLGKMKEEYEKLQKQYADITEKIRSAPGDMKDALAAQQKEIEQTMKRVLAGNQEEKNKPKDTPMNQEDARGNARDAVRKGGETLATIGGIVGTAHALTRFYGDSVEWPNKEPASNSVEKVIGVLNDIKHKSMKDVFTCAKTGTYEQLYPQLAKLSDPGYRTSVELIVKVCSRSDIKERMETSYNAAYNGKPPKPFEELTIEEYMQRLGGGGNVISAFVDKIATQDFATLKKMNIEELLRSEGSDLSLAFRDIMNGALNKTNMRERLKQQYGAEKAKKIEQSMENFSLISLLDYVKENGAEMLGTVSQFEPKNEDDVMGAAIQEICIQLPTGAELLPFFHEVFPNAEWSNDKDANAAIVDQYLKNDISVSKAVRIFAFHRMLKAGNPTGAALLQFEILHFISDKDANWLSKLGIKSKGAEAFTGLAEKVASGTFAKALQESNQLDEKTVKAITDSLTNVLNLTGQAAIGLAAGAAGQAIGKMKGAADRHYEVAYPLGVAGVSAASFAAYKRVYDSLLHPRRDLGAMVKAIAKNGETGFGQNAINAALGRANIEAYGTASTVMSQIDTLVKAHPAKAGPVKEAIQKCFASGWTDDAINELATVVSATYAKEGQGATIAIQNFATKAENAAAREVIRKHHHFFKTLASRFGTMGAVGLMNAYLVYSDVASMRNTAVEAMEARDKGKRELASATDTRFNVELAETAYHGSSIVLSPWMIARVGLRGSIVAGIATEAVFAGWEDIVNNVEKDIRAISTTEDEAKSLSKEQLISTLRDHSGETSWLTRGQLYRQWLSFGGWASWVTRDEIRNESEAVRENLLSGFLTQRLLSQARAGDISAMSMLTLVKQDEQSKQQQNLWRRYVQLIQGYMEDTYGTKNDLTALGDSFDRKLLHAEKFAQMTFTIIDYQRTIQEIQKKEQEQQELIVKVGELHEQKKADTDEYRQVEKILRKNAVEVQSLKEIAELLGTLEFSDSNKQKKSLAELSFKPDGKPVNVYDPVVRKQLGMYVDSYINVQQAAVQENELAQLKEQKPETFEQYITYMMQVRQATNDAPNSAMYDMLTQYATFLDMHQSFDPKAELRTKIRALPDFYWSDESKCQLFLKDVRTVFDKHVKYNNDRRYQLFPADRTKAPTERLNVGKEEMLMREESNISVMIDGKEYNFAEPKNTKEKPEGVAIAVPCGTLVCKYDTDSNGTRLSKPSWYLKADKPANIYIYTHNANGVEIPGKNVTIDKKTNDAKDISRTQKIPGVVPIKSRKPKAPGGPASMNRKAA